jgi:hypothetical protein
LGVLWQETDIVQLQILVLKLKTLHPVFRAFLCNNYFVENEHFCIANFSRIILEKVQAAGDQNHLSLKQLLFTRKTGAMLELKQNREAVFGGDLSGKVRVEDFFQSLDEFEKALDEFTLHPTEQILYLLVDTAKSTRTHLSMLLQNLDKAEAKANGPDRPGNLKCFVLVLHFPAHRLMQEACHSASFLRSWEMHFFDMKHSATPVHVRGFVSALTKHVDSSASAADDSAACMSTSRRRSTLDNLLADQGVDDVFWYFAARLSLTASAHSRNGASDMGSRRAIEGEAQLWPLFSADASLGQRVKALSQAVAGTGDLIRRLKDAFYSRYSEQRVDDVLVSVAERVAQGD